jgi:hypothetical protein
MMNTDQCHDFCKLFVKEMVTGCVPCALVGNMFMKQALSMIGVSLSAKNVAGWFLNEIFSEQVGCVSPRGISLFRIPCYTAASVSR